MRSLKEVYGLNQRILKEEIDFPSNKATVYHLCGNKVGVPDPFDSLSKTKARKGALGSWNETGQTGGDIKATERVKANLKKYSPFLFEPDANTRSSLGGLNKLMNPENKSKRAQAIKRNLQRGGARRYYESINTVQGKAYYLAKSVMTDPYSTGSYFAAGGGDAYGKGLYTCYEFNPKIARGYGDVILRFEVDLTNFMVFTEEIAKGIHGENYRLEDQFRTIITRKGYDYDKLVSDPKIIEFVNFLKSMSSLDYQEDQSYSLQAFAGTKGTDRTAGICIDTLKELSIKTENAILLRNLIEGVVFHGDGDGPVCIIYHPEIATNYILTGAGYFHPETRDAVIHDDIEELAGRKSSIQLKDYIKIQQEELESDDDKQDALDRQKQSNLKAIKRYVNRKLPDEEDLSAIKSKEEAFLKIYDILTEKILPGLYNTEIGKRIIELRSELSGGKVLDDVANIISHFLYGMKTLPSELLSPAIDGVEIISGKNIEIMSGDEFLGYLSNLRNMKIRKTRKLNSFEDLKTAYEGFSSGATVSGIQGTMTSIDPAYPLNEDPNISKQDLDKVWNASYYLQTLPLSRQYNNALQRMHALSEILDGDDKDEYLSVFNIKTTVPVKRMHVDMFLGKNYTTEVYHEHLKIISEEGIVSKIDPYFKEIHEILKNPDYKTVFNKVAQNFNLYESWRHKTFDFSSPNHAFDLGFLTTHIDWASQSISIGTTLFYLYSMIGVKNNITDIIDSGLTKKIDNINIEKLFDKLDLLKILSSAKAFDFDAGNIIFSLSDSNKERTIENIAQIVKKDLIKSLGENVTGCLDNSLARFIDEIAIEAGQGNRYGVRHKVLI